MFDSASAADVLGAMITPAVLISASGTLALSTSQRLSRVVDRVRVLASQAEHLPVSRPDVVERRCRMIADQLEGLSTRALLLRAALTALYLSIGLLVATSIMVGVAAALRGYYGWLAVGLGLSGTCVLLYSSALLVREARLAVGSLLHEMDEARQVVAQTSLTVR